LSYDLSSDETKVFLYCIPYLFESFCVFLQPARYATAFVSLLLANRPTPHVSASGDLINGQSGLLLSLTDYLYAVGKSSKPKRMTLAERLRKKLVGT
jgi:hypothetical protein